MSDRIYYSEESKEYAMRKRTALAALSMLVGVGIGAILALLFAPEEGQSLRQGISERAQNQLENSGEITNSAIASLENKYNDLRQFVESRIDILN